MNAPDLVLRDIHQPPPPPWWPPAPGWWILAAAVLLVSALALWWLARRRARRRQVAALFDDALAAAPDAAAQVAAISELLRRAARRRDPGADRLQGADWLRWLDRELAPARFSTGPGRLLLDGGFRREVPDAEVAALRTLARGAYLELMRDGRRARRPSPPVRAEEAAP
ncbi:MAG: DUF4381 family protein [Gammaproteobacteria bacterium]